MYFKIDIDDFWLDEDEDLEKGLKLRIISEVVSKIYKKIEEKVEKQITTEVKAQTEEYMSKKGNAVIEKIFSEEKIYKPGYSRGDKVTIGEYTRLMFEENSGYSNPNHHLNALAEKFAKELKARYDIMFATHVVAKVNEQGMLKEDVAKLLLEDIKK